MARKPLMGTVAANVLEFGTGAINVDGCMIATNGEQPKGSGSLKSWRAMEGRSNLQPHGGNVTPDAGRWPSNLIHDGSEEVTALLGDAARFFYCAKASKRDRDEGLEGFEANYAARGNGFSDKISDTKTPRANNHPTVKPTELMRYLCRLVTPPGGLILDPFAGSGSTGKAAALEEFRFIGIEKEAEFAEIARQRIAHVSPDVSTKDNVPTVCQLSLFE